MLFLCVSRCNALGSTLPTMFPLWCSRLVCSVILTLSTFLCLIHVAYQSTCFCAEHNLHTQPLYVWPFSKTLVHTLLRFKFKPWFTQAHALCQSASSYYKQNADSQKKRVFSVSTPCFMCLLRLSPRPQLHALGWLAGLLSSKLSSAAVASP